MRISDWSSDVCSSDLVVAEMRRAQRVLDDAVAMLHRLLGLDQRRDLDQMLDAEEPREIERDEEGEGGLGLGDQEAERRGGIDVLTQLRDHHKHRSEKRRVGKEGVRTCRSWWWPVN